MTRVERAILVVEIYLIIFQIDYLPKVEIKDYNVMIDGKNFFD